MIRAWHFVGKTLRDGSKIPRNGRVLKWDGPLVMCEKGLHASREPFDALQYAPGETLCLVECGGKIIEQDDKLVCRERTIIARMDATEMLRYFARMRAVSVIHLWDAPDVVCDYLMTGDEKIRRAAMGAAWAAALDAATAAERAAARDAAWAAALDAALDAARAAARAAAWAAARDEFNQLVYECFEDFL